MYESHFGLRGRPFRPGLDSSFYYPATTHERAVARLLQAIRDDESLCLLIGAPGTGKTLVCHRLIEQLGADTRSAFITNSHLSNRIALFQAILFDLCVPYEGKTEQELRLALTEHLLAGYADGGRTLIVIDEAHLLTTDLLEELRLLANLEAGAGKALQIVLAAQPEFVTLLGNPELTVFAQRLAVRVTLQPLDANEAADYVLHRIRIAGGRTGVFTDEAVAVIVRGSRCIPRVMNQIAHEAMMLAHGVGSTTVDVEAATEAMAVLGIELPAADDGGNFPAIAGMVDDSMGATKPPVKPTRTRRRPTVTKPERRPA